MYRQLRSEFSGRLATVTLDRAERRNAFSADLMREMIACAQELSSRGDIDAVIVTGAGGSFSAGADLKDSSRWAGGAPLLEQREIASLGFRMARAWEELPQMTIAAIEGYAVGGGLALAVALDWRVIRPRRLRLAAGNLARHPAHLGDAPAARQPGRTGQGEAPRDPVRARPRRSGLGAGPGRRSM